MAGAPPAVTFAAAEPGGRARAGSGGSEPRADGPYGAGAGAAAGLRGNMAFERRGPGGAGRMQLRWVDAPRAVLVVKKPGDEACTLALEDLARGLLARGLSVHVEPAVLRELAEREAAEEAWGEEAEAEAATSLRGRVQSWQEGACPRALHELVDLVVTMGGDGTLLYASHLFNREMPPCLAFSGGTLGFLTSYSLRNVEAHVDRALAGLDAPVLLRHRLQCTTFTTDGQKTNDIAYRHPILNEVLIERGPAVAAADFEIFIDGVYFSNVVADGVMVATPTGSTAYSMSAGGSIAHPEMPAMLLTPVCPFSLSFRPLVLPWTSEVEIKVSEASRCAPVVSFDGRNRRQLAVGDSVIIQSSPYPLPNVIRETATEDWGRSIKEALNWNQRIVQRKHSGKAPTTAKF